MEKWKSGKVSSKYVELHPREIRERNRMSSPVLVQEDGRSFLERTTQRFDLLFADALPGEYSHLQAALDTLKPGGIYVVDDMLPQPNWPADHAPKAAALLETLCRLPSFATTRISWSTGLVLCVRTGR